MISLIGFSQRSRVVHQNLPNFDKAKFHFGFILGYNSADFFLDTKPGTLLADSLLSLNVIKRPGFNLGIVSSWNITPLMKLRFLPTLSFQERTFEYTFYETRDSSILWSKKLESTFLDFPLLLKISLVILGILLKLILKH